MFYEKLNFKVDLDLLRQAVTEHVFPLGDQVVQGKEYETPQYRGFGGWTITSRTGDWRDGWETFQTEQGEVLEKFLPTPELIAKSLKYFNMAHSLEHDKPTPAYVGEIRKVVEQISELGLTPRRVRVACLKAGCKSLVHKDADTSEYMARIHIPLWTDLKAVFIADGEHLHMPADGSAYMVWVNVWHQIRNDSEVDRYHLIMDAYDTKHITENFKYLGDFAQLENFSRGFREQIEAAELSEDDKEFFKAIKDRYTTKKIDN